MKVDIIGEPVFWIEIDIETVEVLVELARHHYDGVCRSAGLPGGILYGWHNQLSHYIQSGSSSELPKMRGRFRDLDLLLKICEVAQYAQPVPLEKIWKFVQPIKRALSLANQQNWKLEVEL